MANKYTVTTGNNLAWDSDATWSPISIRSDAFQWTLSGSGTNEYYLQAAGGGNPTSVLSGFVEPANVQENGSAMTGGTAGSLAAGAWDWADNDTLGYFTVYVRLTSGAADPDARTSGFLTFTDSPNVNDNVYFRGSGTFKGGDFSGVELDDVVFMPGFSGSVGDQLNPLKVDMGNANRLEVTASGVIYLSVGNASVSPHVEQTASASNGQAGLYLVDCSALNDLFIKGGTTKLVSSSVGDVYVVGAGSILADANSTCTADIHNNGGAVIWDGNGVDLFNDGGTATINGTDAWATLHCTAGTIFYNASGAVTQAIVLGDGVIDFTGNSVAQTVTTPKAEGAGRIIYNNDTTTFTNPPTGDGVQQIKGGAN